MARDAEVMRMFPNIWQPIRKLDLPGRAQCSMSKTSAETTAKSAMTYMVFTSLYIKRNVQRLPIL